MLLFEQEGWPLAHITVTASNDDASTIAGRTEDAVLDFQEQVPRDDIAILVLRVSDVSQA
jgi:hypothetical protein